MAKYYTAREGISARQAPFYEINPDYFISSEQHQIDEIKCHIMREKLAQKLPQRAFQANHGQVLGLGMRQDFEEMTMGGLLVWHPAMRCGLSASFPALMSRL